MENGNFSYGIKNTNARNINTLKPNAAKLSKAGDFLRSYYEFQFSNFNFLKFIYTTVSYLMQSIS